MIRERAIVGCLALAALIFSGAGVHSVAHASSAALPVGSLSISTSGATLGGVTLNGKGSQSVTGTVSSAWSISDSRATGARWTVAVTATAPTSAAGTVDTHARTIPVGNLSISPGTITASLGADPVGTTLTATVLNLSTKPQTLIASTGSNKGTYTLTPTFTLRVPANAFRSNWPAAIGSGSLTPYSATLTYTIA